MARLIIEGKDVAYSILDKPLIIGRASQCDIFIHDGRASRKHCEVGHDRDKNAYYLRDLNSYNGTYLNEKKVSFSLLRAGDKIRIGKTSFTFSLEAQDGEDPSDRVSTPAASYLVIHVPKKKPRIHKLMLKPCLLGRLSSNDVCLQDAQVSSKHAEIFLKENEWWIRDLRSRNGVFVNNRRIDVFNLKQGDVIRLGETNCTFTGMLSKTESPCVRTSTRLTRCLIAVIVLFTLGIAIFWGKSYKFEKLPEIPGNLLEDFSFEDGIYWECRGQMHIVADGARSGKSCLRFQQLRYTAKFIGP